MVLLGLTACGQGVAGTAAVGSVLATPSTKATPTSSSASTSADPTLASGVTIDELADDITAAQTVADSYWTLHWADFFTGTWTGPTVIGLYDGEDPSDTPTCGGEPLESFNAYYCVPEDYVAWDSGLLVTGADQIGDSWVYLVIAHEYGHAVQARLDPSLVAEGDELQADCLGAAALYGSITDGTLTFDGGDEAELIGSLTALADQMPWTMSSDHGDAFQRVQAFTLGRNGGVNACLDVEPTTADDPTTDTWESPTTTSHPTTSTTDPSTTEEEATTEDQTTTEVSPPTIPAPPLSTPAG